MKNAGFTMIELLVVIVVLGILIAASGGAYAHFVKQANQRNAADICSQIKTAWSSYHRDLGFWPEVIKKSGEQQMDVEMCEILGSAQLLDVLYIDDDDPNLGLQQNKDNEPELSVGMLSPLGLKKFNAGRRSNLKDDLYHFVIDANEDGIVDASDGLPVGPLEVQRVRGDVAVWCWDEGKEEAYAKSW